MEYMVSDLIRALLRARERGPEAEALFRRRFNQASARIHAGESEASALFDLIDDAAENDKPC